MDSRSDIGTDSSGSDAEYCPDDMFDETETETPISKNINYHDFNEPLPQVREESAPKEKVMIMEQMPGSALRSNKQPGLGERIGSVVWKKRGGAAMSDAADQLVNEERRNAEAANEDIPAELDIEATFMKEQKAVRKFKLFVILVLVLAAVSVTLLVYRTTSDKELEDFNLQYQDYAAKFITNFHHLQAMRQWAANTAAAMYTGRCVNNYGPPGQEADGKQNFPWPNLTLPDYADMMRGVIATAQATTIEFSPLFQNDLVIRKQWEAYAVEYEDWVLHIPDWAKMDTHGGGHGGGDGSMDMDDGGESMNHSDAAAMDHGGTIHHMGDSIDHGETMDHGDPAAGHSMNHNATMNHNETMNHGDGGDNAGHSLEHGAAMNHGDSADIDSDTLEAMIREANHGKLRGRRANTDHDMIDNMNGHPSSNNEHDTTDTMSGHSSYIDGDQYLIGDQEHPRRPFEEGIYTMDGHVMVDEGGTIDILAPSWQIAPLMGKEGKLLYNEYSSKTRRRAIDTMLKTKGAALTEILYGNDDDHHFYPDPSSIMLYPVFDSFESKDNMVGFVAVTFSWIGSFWNILPENVQGIIAEIETSTGQISSFRVDGNFGTFLGYGEFPELKDNSMKVSSSVYGIHENDVHRRGLWDTSERTEMVLHIYPSQMFKDSYITNQPMIYSLAVSMVFLVTVIAFLIYDVLVEKRQKKLLTNAEQSGKIIYSLFPAMVRDRLFKQSTSPLGIAENGAEEEKNEEERGVRGFLRNPKGLLFGSATHSDSSTAPVSIQASVPIADLYHDCTVLFADIAGFTAWSSEREPYQVFQLLELVFCEFDLQAKQHGVFKVETIGDCYVCVTGLPNATADHAVIMAQFSQVCMGIFSDLVKELELQLGPGTADLGLRVGLHSGPVTAGVLRGEKARFQLFGDTMNTASRMESTSIRNMIQITSETAECLKERGKGGDYIARDGLIKAKGKGYMQTFWLRPKSLAKVRRNSNPDEELTNIHSRAQHDEARAELGLPSFTHNPAQVTNSTPSESETPSGSGGSNSTQTPGASEPWSDTGMSSSHECVTGHRDGWRRLIKWNTAVLESILAKVVSHRNRQQRKRMAFKLTSKKGLNYDESAVFSEEIATFIPVPRFNRDNIAASTFSHTRTPVGLIPAIAREELRAYVGRIASMYRDVHFHNFEHASHVCMSAQKLLNKIVMRNKIDFPSAKKRQKPDETDDLVKQSEESDLFFSTYGISADPLAQFAVVFAALVHDVDHTGVPNVLLIKEKPGLAEKYNSKSVAENNSIMIAWRELMQPEFSNLRACIFGTNEDESRFRQLLINVVIATDIADRERRMGERKRWQAAFSNLSAYAREWRNKDDSQLPNIDVSLKATVVLEQIVLASDVAHTMQHWLTYVKWNERFYKENWAAYVNGRTDTDPTANWYEGEIGFFDGYIIPLATKLKECGVFGNAGDEYLGNALRNKVEWIEKGKAIVAEFETKIKKKTFNVIN
mmetsp:Transcript_32070/g.47359  ORF Transcript_32070/g.47359 Transcript_32070/m.47359 type:complete len:1480 (+) Transcript_32070:183-4622(+)